MRRAAFTLVETLIAISLGMMVVAVAWSAFRAATQTVSIANRIALENALLRAGVSAAHDELDLWREYDDPNSATQPLRATRQITNDPRGNYAIGLPFSRFHDVWRPIAGGNDAESDEHYRADAKAWDPSDSRTWYRGDLCEHSTSKMWFGRYGEFSTERVEPPNIPSYSAPVDAAQSVDWMDAPPATHHWYPFQIAALRDALGFYALLDYTPANSIYSTFDPGAYPLPTVLLRNGAVTSWYDTNPGDPMNGGFRVYELSHSKVPPGKYRCTASNAYAVIDPHATATPAIDLFADHRAAWGIGKRDLGHENDSGGAASTANQVGLFLARTDVHAALLPYGAPASWPNASVSVSHFIKNARPINICKVRLVSPVTGQSMTLTFSSFGTTLRGARQQRGRDGGWASWDDTAAAANTPTLDDP